MRYASIGVLGARDRADFSTTGSLTRSIA